MNVLIASLLFSIVPHSDIVSDRVDIIELNHLFDPQGKHVFSQWIFWDWNDKRSRHDVVEWVMGGVNKGSAKVRPDESLRAQVMTTSNGWRLRFRHAGVQREVIAQEFREVYSQYDREMEQRMVLPKERRRELSKSRISRSTIQHKFQP